MSSGFRLRDCHAGQALLGGSRRIGGRPDLATTLWTSFGRGRQATFSLSVAKIGEVKVIEALVEHGRHKPVIDRVYPLAEAGAAHAYVKRGRKRGNVVISVGYEA